MSKFTRLLSGRKAQPKAQKRHPIRPRIEALEERALLTLFWTGAGGNDLWTNENNWYDPAVGLRVPVNGDDLEFPSSGEQLTNDNNIPTVLQVNSIRFTGSGYTLRGNQFQFGAGGMTQSVSGTNRIANPIALPATRTFDITAGTLVLGGTLSGTGGVTKTGAGRLTYSLANANTYTGTTTVNAGTLSLEKNGVVAVPGPLVVGDNGLGDPNEDVVRLEADNQIANARSVTVNRTGLLDLNGHDEIITGLTLLGGSVTNSGTGTLQLLGNVTTNQSFVQANISGGELFMAAANPTFNVADGLAEVDLRVSADVTSFFQRPLVKTGAGRMVFSGDNTFSGTLSVSAGILSMRSLGALGQAIGGTNVANGAALEVHLPGLPVPITYSISEPLTLNGPGFGNPGMGALLFVNAPFPFQTNVTWTGEITLNTTAAIGVLVPFTGNNLVTLSGLIKPPVPASTTGLLKLGPGLARLTANNTYTGPTTVSAGTLLIDGSQPSSAVTVNNGGTLGGLGTIGTLVANSGGTVSPGTLGDDVGTLTVQGNVTLNSGSTLSLRRNPGPPTASDRLLVTGPANRMVTINNATLDATISFAAAPNTEFRLIENLTAGPSTGSFRGIPRNLPTQPPPTFTVRGVSGAPDQPFRLNYTGGDGNDLIAFRNTPPMVQYLLLYPEEISAGSFTYLVGQLTDPDAEPYLGLYISWGDGSADQVEYPGLEPFVFAHRYASPGVYYVLAYWFDESGEGNYRYLPLIVLGGSAPGQGTPPPDDVRSLVPASRGDTAPPAHPAAALRAVPREMTTFRGAVTAGPAGSDGQDSFSAHPGRERVTELYDEAFLKVLSDLDLIPG